MPYAKGNFKGSLYKDAIPNPKIRTPNSELRIPDTEFLFSSYLLKGRISEMQQFLAPVPEEHLHFLIVHEFGYDTLAKGRMAYPVTRTQGRRMTVVT